MKIGPCCLSCVLTVSIGLVSVSDARASSFSALPLISETAAAPVAAVFLLLRFRAYLADFYSDTITSISSDRARQLSDVDAIGGDTLQVGEAVDHFLQLGRQA